MNGQPWTPEQLEQLIKLYPNTSNIKIAEILGRAFKSINSKACRMKLRKSPEYMLTPEGGRIQKGENRGNCFSKGHTPKYKGKKLADHLSPEKLANMSKSHFKKGHIPATAKKADGEISVWGGRYQHIRVSLSEWIPYHHYLWQQVNGEIQEGYNIVFKDGNKMNCTLENLEMISKREHYSRNAAPKKLTPNFVSMLLSKKDKALQKEILTNHQDIIKAATLTYKLNRKIKEHGKK